jgi:hypothetical protein
MHIDELDVGRAAIALQLGEDSPVYGVQIIDVHDFLDKTLICASSIHIYGNRGTVCKNISLGKT